MSYTLWDGTLLVYQLRMLPNRTICIPKIGQKKHRYHEKTAENAWFIYHWDSEISTCDEKYYKHQQSLFIDFYNAR